MKPNKHCKAISGATLFSCKRATPYRDPKSLLRKDRKSVTHRDVRVPHPDLPNGLSWKQLNVIAEEQGPDTALALALESKKEVHRIRSDAGRKRAKEERARARRMRRKMNRQNQ